jgi:hypothetical protein
MKKKIKARRAFLRDIGLAAAALGGQDQKGLGLIG